MQNEKTKKTKSARKIALVVVCCLLACLLLVFLRTINADAPPQMQSISVSVGGGVLQVEKAVTQEQQAAGLCCRDALPKNAGMLFLYEEEGDYGFWMKDTRIPLDIIWIDSEKKIVHIEPAVEPSSYPKSFSSPYPAQYILETNANWAKENDIQLGDLVSF